MSQECAQVVGQSGKDQGFSQVHKSTSAGQCFGQVKKKMNYVCARDKLVPDMRPITKRGQFDVKHRVAMRERNGANSLQNGLIPQLPQHERCLIFQHVYLSVLCLLGFIAHRKPLALSTAIMRGNPNG